MIKTIRCIEFNSAPAKITTETNTDQQRDRNAIELHEIVRVKTLVALN